MNAAAMRRWMRYHGLFRPLARLPQPLAYRGAALIGDLDYRSVILRSVIADGLRRALPEETADPAVLNAWVRGYCRMMARETLDVFTMPRVHRGDNPGLVSLRPESLEVLAAAREERRGVIIVMAHFSRLNLLLLALGLAGQRLGMLTIPVDQRNPDLDAVERAYLQRKVANLHARIRGPWVTLADNLRHLYGALERGETMVILMDAFIPGDTSRISLPFLGGQLQVAQGVERLARRTGATLIYGVVHERGWRAEAELRALPRTPEEALLAAVAELERDVGATPWQWWHWNILDYIWTPGGDGP